MPHYTLFIIFACQLASCSNTPSLKSKPATSEKSEVALEYGMSPKSKPLSAHSEPPTPHLLKGRNGIHYDTYNSDVTNAAGPLGINPSVVTHKLNGLGKSIPTALFDSKGRLYRDKYRGISHSRQLNWRLGVQRFSNLSYLFFSRKT